MASATIKEKMVIEGVTLELSLDEAKALRVFMGYIGGCPKTTIRKHADAIYNTLVNKVPLNHGKQVRGHIECLPAENC